MKGRFPGVSYYMTILPIEKVQIAHILKKHLNMENASFADRVQRTLNEKRAKEEIYKKYLLNEGTRFFNSLVVTIIPDKEDRGFYIEECQGENIYKLSLSQYVKKVVVDGQHRLSALRKLREDIIKGKLDDREDLKNLQIPIIFVLYNKIDSRIENSSPIKSEIIKETRRVFTALNKTAKKIDKYTTLIVDDSDFSAVVSRKILEDGLVDELYVKWAFSSTSLNQADVYFTTLNIINDMVEYYSSKLNKSLDDEDLSTDNKSKELIERYFESVVEEIGASPKILIQKFFQISFFNEWKKLLENLDIKLERQPNETILNKKQKEKIKELRDKNILAQVVGQKALFGAIVEALPKIGDTPNIRVDEVYNRVESLISIGVLKKSNDIWKGVLVGEDKKGKMIARQQNMSFAKDILEILLTFDKYKKRELESKIDNLKKLLSEKLGVVNRGNKIREIIEELEE